MAIKAKKSLEESSKEIDRRIEALFASPKTDLTQQPSDEKIAVMVKALKAARNDLEALNGLIAFDANRVSHDKRAIRIDVSAVLELIDLALKDSTNG